MSKFWTSDSFIVKQLYKKDQISFQNSQLVKFQQEI